MPEFGQRARRRLRPVAYDVDAPQPVQLIGGNAQVSGLVIPVDGGAWSAPVEEDLGYPFEHYNPIQAVALERVGNDENLVVATATNTGKTTVAEILGRHTLRNGGRVGYVSPLRAVTEQNYSLWNAPNCKTWVIPRRISIITGDYRLTPKRQAEVAYAEIIMLTSEMLASRCRRMEQESNDWLLKIGTLIIDEAHLLTTAGRGDHLEAGIMNFTRINPSARIVFLSATMGNPEQLGAWLSSLNGKPSFVVASSWRPTELRVHLVPCVDWRNARMGYEQGEKAKQKAAMDVVREFPNDQMLVFVHTKAMGERFYKGLMGERIPCGYHYGDLDHRHRQTVEKDFRDGTTRVLVATPTLAWGMNLPARRVVVVGVTRGMSDVEPLEIAQECGRAGRSGFDTHGDAHVIVPESQIAIWQQRLSELPQVQSRMTQGSTLAFHIINEINEGSVDTIPKVLQWVGRSLAASQMPDWWNATRVGGAVADLLEKHLVEVTSDPYVRDEGGDVVQKMVATWEGKVASWMYLDPFDVAEWTANFRTLLEEGIIHSDSAVCWAVTNVPSVKGYIARGADNQIAEYQQDIGGYDLRVLGDAQLAAGAALYWHLKGRCPPILSKNLWPVQSNMDRWVQAWTLLDKHVLRSGKPGLFETLALRIRYGVSKEAAELCRLPGIGKVRAGHLMRAGISTFYRFVMRKDEAQTLIGSKAYKKAIVTLARWKRDGKVEITKEE